MELAAKDIVTIGLWEWGLVVKKSGSNALEFAEERRLLNVLYS